jgi:hypothetical protein
MGVYIPDITVEILRKVPLKAIEALLAEGEMYDVELPCWVSVEDSKPNEDNTYLVAWVEKHHNCPYPHYYGMLTWDTEMNDWLDFDKLKPLHKDDEIKILAWMPLPLAYEGVDDEEST